MNIYKDVFTYNKKDLKKLNSEEIIKKFNRTWYKRIKLIMKLTKKNYKNATLNLLYNKKYEEYIKLLTDLGIVIPFTNELLKKMENVTVGDKTLMQHFINYTTRGLCESMSVALSTVFEEETVIKSGTLHMPIIEIFHQWLEYNGKVYDTTMHLIFPIDYYYDIYTPKNIHQLTNDEIESIKNDVYYEIRINNPIKK